MPKRSVCNQCGTLIIFVFTFENINHSLLLLVTVLWLLFECVLLLERAFFQHHFSGVLFVSSNRFTFLQASRNELCFYHPKYLCELFVQPSSQPSRQSVHSASSNQLNVSLVKLSTYRATAFSCSSPPAWNSLSTEYLSDLSLSRDVFSLQYFKVILVCSLL